ncbi:MAG: hypothetical protein RLZZ584_2160, partial [Pseudomonadota bacterium]
GARGPEAGATGAANEQGAPGPARGGASTDAPGAGRLAGGQGGHPAVQAGAHQAAACVDTAAAYRAAPQPAWAPQAPAQPAPPYAQAQAQTLAPGGPDAQRQPGTAALPPRSLEDIEIYTIRQAVDAAGGNISEAAKALGISRNTIYRKLRWNVAR